MGFEKIYTVADKFRKQAQQELNDANIKRVVAEIYEDLNVAPPDDIRIQYEETGDKPSRHVQPKYYNVYIWTNSYLEPHADATVQGRLHAAFDPEDKLYNFYMKYFD